MERVREDDRRAMGDGAHTMGATTVLVAFGFGLLAGAVFTLLTTPESGTSIRNRLKRGKETAGKEFDEVVGEAKEKWTAVGGDVREAVKRTASRVKQAAELTKEALTSSDASVRRVP